MLKNLDLCENKSLEKIGMFTELQSGFIYFKDTHVAFKNSAYILKTWEFGWGTYKAETLELVGEVL